MDLVEQFKESFKNPFSIKSFTVIFTCLFLALISGLATTVLFNFFFSSEQTACSTPFTQNINGTISKDNEKVYGFKFLGNDNCFLNSWITWKANNQNIELWVYDPSGNVNILKGNLLQTHNNFFTNNLALGDWKISLRTESEKPLPFSGQIGIH